MHQKAAAASYKPAPLQENGKCGKNYPKGPNLSWKGQGTQGMVLKHAAAGMAALTAPSLPSLPIQDLKGVETKDQGGSQGKGETQSRC